MAQTFVCDGCGLGEVGTKGPVQQINLEVTNGISFKADVHNNPRCIAKVVKAELEKRIPA